MPRVEALGVAGRPVLHSASPEMCRAGIAARGGRIAYLRLAADSAAEALALARALGLRGLNVTSPFKDEMAALMDRLGPEARAIGAVNAVALTGEGAIGHNTDPEGARAALRAVGADPAGRRAVVVGAGGAGRAAAFALAGGGAADVVVTSRDEGRSRRAALRLGCRHAPWGRAAAEIRGAEIVFLCLPPRAETPPGIEFPPGAFVVDANLSADAPPRAALRAGAACVNGVPWLAAQGAESLARVVGTAGSLPEMLAAAARPERRERRRTIALVGASGAGKSTTARLLAARLGAQHLDADRMAERAAGAPAAEIFAARGEAEWRRLERRAVRAALAFDDAVIALGAGALEDPGTLAAVRERCLVVWLWVDAAGSAARAAGAGRPLLVGDDPGGAASRLIERRTPAWMECADLVLDARARGPGEAAERMAHELDHARSR